MSTMDDWVAAMKAEFGLDLDVDFREMLDVTRTAAQHVARPAAPVTAFLVGYAAAQAGGGADAVGDVCRRTTELAEGWTSSESDD